MDPCLIGLLSEVNEILSDGMPSTLVCEPVRDPVLDYNSRELYAYNDPNFTVKSEVGASGDAYDYYNDVNTGEEHTIQREQNEVIDPRSNLNILENSEDQRIHSVEKQYKCITCGECFSTKNDWKQHKKIHFKEDYQCKYCDKYFTHKKSMIEHQKIHTMEQCSNCDQFFDSKEDLVLHQATHLEEKPHQCSDCGKCFGFKSHLERHQRIHTKDNPVQQQIADTGEKPLHQAMYKDKSVQCSQCGKTYSSKAILDRHQITHTGEKPFECSTCGRCFGYNSHLERHQKVHTRKSVKKH